MNNLYMTSGSMIVHYNRPLTEKEYNKIIKVYNGVGWKVLEGYHTERTQYTFFKGKAVIEIPNHASDE